MENKKSNAPLASDQSITLAGFNRLGCGYDIFGEYASPASMRKQVFDLTPFLNDPDPTFSFKGKHYLFPKKESGYFYFNPQVEKKFVGAAGQSMNSFRQDISNSFNGEGVIEAFTGSLSIDSSKHIYQEDSFAYSLMFYLENNYIIEVFFDNNPANNTPYLIGLFQTMTDAVQTIEDGLNLMKRYGTHVVTKLNVGKRKTQYASVTKSLYESTDDFKALAKASFAEVIGVEDSYEDKTAIKKFREEAYTYEHSYGSDAQNTIIAFPEPESLVPLWKVYKDPNHSISNAFGRLVKTYQFITSILGRSENIVTAIDFAHEAHDLRKKGFTVIKHKKSDADMRKGLGGSYVYMGIKKSSLLDVLKGAQPVTKIIKENSEHAHPKEMEGYTAINCDFLQGVSYPYEFLYYQQTDFSLSSELTNLLAIGNSYNYAEIKEQAYAYATDDKFPVIEQGLQAFQNLKEQEGKTFTDMNFSSHTNLDQIGGYPHTINYYEEHGYKNIMEPYKNQLYIFGKPLNI